MNKVAVIVPNFNHDRYLKTRLDSILNQTYTNFEIILLDDKSTDDSYKVIEEYKANPKISAVVYNEENSGSTFSQWMKGIMLAKTEYIWIAESDDYAAPEFLSSLMELVERYDNVGIAYCDSYKVDANGERMEELHRYMDTEFKSGVEEVKKHLCLYNTITNVSSCLIKTEYAVNAIKGLSEYRTCGDWIFYARLLQHCNLAYTPKRLNYYRWHPKSVSYSASQTYSYFSEGINVIKYIDYKLVRFSLKEYMALCKAWIKKTMLVGNKHMFGSIWVLVFSTYKFFTAKLYWQRS